VLCKNGVAFAAMSQILMNKSKLQQVGRNEAEVRYAVCDPIISMVCDIHTFSLKLEESIKENLDEDDDSNVSMDDILYDVSKLWGPMESQDEVTTQITGQRSIGSVMSEGSKSDYTVYTFSGGHKLKIVAIIDAKKGSYSAWYCTSYRIL
jgi:hypothetical protein